MMYAVSQLAYIVSASLFIFALHWMNTPQTARKGVYAGVAGTALAVLVTWAEPTVVHHVWIIGAIVLGFVVGAILITGGDFPLRIRILGAIALFASMANIVSGFLITDRMLKMFKTDTKPGGSGNHS